ncbi:MAG: helix-turn-helix transcriptional regulator [Lachnospiraceae bacterium]
MRKHIFIFSYFGIGIFAAFEGDAFFGVLTKSVFKNMNQRTTLGFGWILASIGALFFLVLIKANAKAKNAVLITAYLVAATLPLLSSIIRIPAIYWLTYILFYLLEGTNAAICAWYLCRIIKMQVPYGSWLAISISAGCLLSYLVDFIFPDLLIAKALSLLIIIFTMQFIAVRKIGIANLLSYDKEKAVTLDRSTSHQITGMVIAVSFIVSIMSFCIGINNIVILSGLETVMDLSSIIPQALLYLPAIIIAGFVADVKKGKYLSICILILTLMSIPISTMVQTPSTFLEYSGITYFLGGFYLIYILTALVVAAGKSSRPVEISTLAAFLFLFFTGIGALTSKIISIMNQQYLMAIYIVLVSVLLIMFYLSGSLHWYDDSQKKVIQLPNLPPIDELCRKYRITNRECEVLKMLIEGKTTSEIAETMVITERSVQNYISSMLSKTDSKSRGNMIAKFTGFERLSEIENNNGK